MPDYRIQIENCNSIESAEITIHKNTLNIKYGPNGLGKSSMARAIKAAVDGGAALQALKPFKYRMSEGQHGPAVTGVAEIRSVLLFDEQYVSQFVFQRDEVLKNSFEIFIRTEDYLATERDINQLLSGIRLEFDGNLDLDNAISDLRALRDAFEFTKAGTLSKSSKGFKALGMGNRIENIPEGLETFAPYIRSERPASWVAWQVKGHEFLELAERCPYCGSELTLEERKLACSVKDKYDPKAVEHLSALQAVIQRLGDYFSPTCRGSLDKITKSGLELSLESVNFLVGLRCDVEVLVEKLEELKGISFYTLRDGEVVEGELSRFRIDLNLLEKLNSDKTRAAVHPINEKINSLAAKIGELRGKINIHKNRIRKAVAENQDGINDFLRVAGYRYKVAIRPEAESYKMKLTHQDFDQHIEAPSAHLSHGEKNAFALVLFMHQVLREKPDLAIFDDPVSSFDKTKKFAVLNELFRGSSSLRSATVLMLTHDIEPAIDIICCAKRLFQNPKPMAYFLHSRSGVIFESRIAESDIQTFTQICAENIDEQGGDEVIKCIYLRRHLELIDNRGVAYNYLANLLHARDMPIVKVGPDDIPMSLEDIATAVAEIRRSIPDFDYYRILALIKNNSEMKRRFLEATAGYDKIQLFRIFKEVNGQVLGLQNSILQKFVNETFHIENEYVMQLNPRRFDNVPEYIVGECRRLIMEGESE